MRTSGLYDASRGLTLAVSAGLAGLALWGAAEVGTYATWRFWLALAIVGTAGLLLALAHHAGTWTKGLQLRLSPATLLLAVFPAYVCVCWILLANQPGDGWEKGRIVSWSSSIGILSGVHAIGAWPGVLAFALGLVLGLAVDGVPAEGVEDVSAPTADEPVTAERRWSGPTSGTPAPRG